MMNRLTYLLKSEPVLVRAVVVGLAVLVGDYFGIDVTNALQHALDALGIGSVNVDGSTVSVVGLLLLALSQRAKVTPVDTMVPVDEDEDDVMA